MAKNKKINLNTLDQTRKKKKDSIIFGIVILIFTVGVISIGNYFLDTNEQKVFKKRKNQELKNTHIVLTPDKDYKEAWAMSVENTLEKQNKILISFKSCLSSFLSLFTFFIKDIRILFCFSRVFSTDIAQASL